MEKIEISGQRYINNDCLNVFETLPEKYFDLIISDINPGTYNKGNDKAKQFSDTFNEAQLKTYFRTLKKLVSDKGSIVVFSEGILTYQIIDILKDMYKYSLIWKKTRVLGFLNSSKRPLINHSDILIFQRDPKKGNKYEHIYNPQMVYGAKRYSSLNQGQKKKQDNCYGEQKVSLKEDTNLHFPTSVLEFDSETDQLIPMQKPLSLMKWLIETYSNQDSVILDPCMGVATSGVCCKILGRQYLGIEINDQVYNMARERIKNTVITKKIEI